MPTMKRHWTEYPGVYFIEGKRIGTEKPERIYYIKYRTSEGKVVEEKAGRANRDRMTPAKAAGIRGERMAGKVLPNKDRREKEREAKAAETGKWTLSRLFEEYQEQHHGKKLANEKSRYKNYIAPTFGDKEPAAIAPLDVDRLRTNLLKKRKPATVFAILELLRRLVNFGIDRRLCNPLPFKITMPKVNNLKTEDLNAEQMARLLAVLRGERLDDDPPGTDPSIDPDARDVVYMALFTGMRRGEIFRLKWDEIDSRRGFLTIRNPKGGTDTTIPLSDPARELLESRPREKSDYVFPGRYGGKRTDIKRALEKIRKRAKLPEGFRPLHGLRHVFASHLASSGEVDLYTLQRLLTHKSPMMTQRYAHLTDAALKRGANVMSRIVQEAEGKQLAEKER